MQLPEDLSAASDLQTSHEKRVGFWECFQHGQRLRDSLEIREHQDEMKCRPDALAFRCTQHDRWEVP